MIEAHAFVDCLRDAGYTHYSGVPCSFLKPFINYVINADDLDYVTAASEGGKRSRCARIPVWATWSIR